jgi:hypothetical protein
MLYLLEASGFTLDEGDVIKGPWDKSTTSPNPDMSRPKAPVVPINRPSVAPEFKLEKLYKEFINAPQIRQKLAKGPVDDDSFMTMAAEYLGAKLGKVHPRLLGKYAEQFLDINKNMEASNKMLEVDELEEVAKLAGINWNDPNVRAHYDKPTAARVASGETEPVDRTDYDTPPAMRDPMQGKPGFEKRKASLIKQGILKATPEEVEECGVGYELNPMAEAGPADEPVEPDMDADDKRFDDIDEAKYQGREVPLGKPMAGDVKKSKVYVRKPNGKVVKVNFGDKKMKIKKSNPKRRKSFRARHNCKNPGPRWKARYWSCRAW